MFRGKRGRQGLYSNWVFDRGPGGTERVCLEEDARQVRPPSAGQPRAVLTPDRFQALLQSEIDTLSSKLRQVKRLKEIKPVELKLEREVAQKRESLGEAVTALDKVRDPWHGRDSWSSSPSLSLDLRCWLQGMGGGRRLQTKGAAVGEEFQPR